MQVTKSLATRLTIQGVPNLDPVVVYAEDFDPGQGKITITCFGQSWTQYWGSMGDNTTLMEFFLDCSNQYIIGKLAPNTHKLIISDDDNDLVRHLKLAIIKYRRKGDFTKVGARELWEDACNASFQSSTYERICFDVLGDDWWCDLPKVTNHDYAYLSRIIDSVKAAFVQELGHV